MIEWIMFGALVASLAGCGVLGHLWRMAKDGEAEALYLRDKWKDLAEGRERVAAAMDGLYLRMLDDRNRWRARARGMRHDIQLVRTDNQVLENTIISRDNDIADVKALHRDIERDLGERIRVVTTERDEFMRVNVKNSGWSNCQAEGYRSAIRHLSGRLDEAKKNDLRDPRTGRFVSRRPKRGTGQRA